MLAPSILDEKEDADVDDAELEALLDRYNRRRAPSPVFPIASSRRKRSPDDAGVRSPIARRTRSKSGKEEETRRLLGMAGKEGEKKVRNWIKGMVLDSAHQGEE